MPTLSDLAQSIKQNEFDEIFPNHTVEEVLDDQEKMKEAVFQVHFTVWNEELYELVGEHSKYWVSRDKVKETCNENDWERLQKSLRGATMKMEDGRLKSRVETLLTV